MVNYVSLSNEKLDKLLDDAGISYTADTTRAEKIKLHQDFEAADAPDKDTTKKDDDKEDKKDPEAKTQDKATDKKDAPKAKFKKEYKVKMRIKAGEDGKTFYETGDMIPGYPGIEQDLAHAIEL